MRTVNPYSFRHWRRVSRHTTSLLQRVVRAMPLENLDRARAVLTELLGAETGLDLGMTYVCSGETLRRHVVEPFVCVLLVPPPNRAERLVLLEWDVHLAMCVLDRVLGGEAGVNAGTLVGLPTPMERGVLLYVVARMCSVLDAEPWRVGSLITNVYSLETTLQGQDCIVWPMTVSIAQDRGTLRVWLPEHSVTTLPPPSAIKRAWLGALILPWVIELGGTSLTRDELRSIEIGDVVVLDRVWARRVGTTWQGAARARVEESSRTTWWCIICDRQLGIERIEYGLGLSKPEGRVMSQDVEEGTLLLERLGDAPVEVIVELARFWLPLEQLSALREGEIVETGRPLGDFVALRIGHRTLARGELVDIEGEVGVRITQIVAGE